MDGQELGRTLSAVLPAPHWALVAATGMVGLLTVVSGLLPRWRSRWAFGLGAVGVLAHETGHALIAVVTGGGVYTVRVDSPDSGVTHHWFYSWFGAVLTKFGGYAAPPLLGLGAAALLDQGKVAAVLTFTTVAMAVLLLIARGLLTVATVLSVGVAAFATLHWGGPLLQQTLAYSLAWLLLLAEISGVVVLVKIWWHGRDHDPDEVVDDATGMAALTRLPAPVWIAAWAAILGWSLWLAIPLLWP